MIKRYSKNWPKCFPEGCPPETASEQDVSVYRLCYKREGPDFCDFLCDFINSEKSWRYARNGTTDEEIIDGHGISVFNNFESALSMRSSRRMRNHYKSIACGEGRKGFSKQQGKNQNHLIWWAYADVNPMTHFRLVYQGEENDV